MLLAPSCATCDAVLHQLRNSSICEHCWSAIRPDTPPFCDRCGAPLPSLRQRLDRLIADKRGSTAPEHDSECRADKTVAPVAPAADPIAPPVCAHCTAGQGEVSRARAIGGYDGALRDIIHALKYGKRPSIAPRLGRLMRQHGADALADADIAVPVPLHWSRRRWRGFNQAELLAAQLGLPIGHVLRRVRRTRPQVALPARARQANVEDAFALRRPDRWHWPGWLRLHEAATVDGLTVVLVDDVCTTGATLEACARVLRHAGAKEVRAITAARVATRQR